MKKWKRFFMGLLAFPFAFLTACASADNGLPFDEPLAETFNYCPSVIEEDDGTRYVYYCSTAISGVVQDHIYCRKGTRNAKGGYSWSEKTLVLAPRSYTEYFDAFHCCDPCVIEGEFTYKGTQYSYLMAYTGNTSNINNKVGLAVSNSLMSGWVALDNPLVTYSGDISHWGVGQPSLISVDKKSKVQLIYSVGGTSTYNVSEQWDFSNLDAPVRLSSSKITEKGLTNLNGGVDYLSNVDMTYDPVTKRYYAVSDCHPNPTDGEPSFVGSHFRVTYLSEKGTTFGASLAQDASRSWMNLATIGPSETGFPRNSNCAIVRDSYGWLRDSNEIEVFYSISQVTTRYEWTYRIYSYKIAVEE